MTPNDYQRAALRTESIKSVCDPTRFGHKGAAQLNRIMHAMIGVCTEAGELQDAVKKHLFYDKPLDLVNVAEELVDCAWYIAIGLDACGMTMEDAMERNIAKLKARFGDKFSDDKALNRDLDAERRTLEGAAVQISGTGIEPTP